MLITDPQQDNRLHRTSNCGQAASAGTRLVDSLNLDGRDVGTHRLEVAGGRLCRAGVNL